MRSIVSTWPSRSGSYKSHFKDESKDEPVVGAYREDERRVI